MMVLNEVLTAIPYERAIKELVARRFQARDLQSQIEATESQSYALGAVLGDYVIYVKNNTPEDLISKLMEAKFAKITEQLQNVRKNIHPIFDARNTNRV